VTLKERLRQLASALPSDHSAVTITRADLIALLEADMSETGVVSPRDLPVEEVAHETHRAPSTVPRLAELTGASRPQVPWGLACNPSCSS